MFQDLLCLKSHRVKKGFCSAPSIMDSQPLYWKVTNLTLIFKTFKHICKNKSCAMDLESGQTIKKTKCQNEKKDGPINGFDRLPYEIATDMLSTLPITSLVQLSFSCKSLKSLSHDPNFVSLHMSKSSTNDSECLILHSAYPIKNQLHFLRLSDKKVRKINIPLAMAMSEFNIIGSSNGLLCLINTLFPESIYLYNPFAQDHLEIPKNFEFRDEIVVYGFGFLPVTNDYTVIKIAYYTNSYFQQMAVLFPGSKAKANYDRQLSEVWIYSLRSNAWQNRGIVPFRLELWSSPGVLVSGRLHWVSRWVELYERFEKTIVSYDLADDSFDVIYNPTSDSESYERWAPCHLGSLDGCLSAAVPMPTGDGAFSIWIMKEYGDNESWVKAYNIGPYYPVSNEMERYHHFWRNIRRALCVLKSGELLLEYRLGGLVTYDPRNETFEELVYPGMPRMFETVVHVGSLRSAPFPFL